MLRRLLLSWILWGPAPAQDPAAPEAASRITLPIQVHLDPIFRDAERGAPRVPPGVETWTPLPDSPGGPLQYRFNLYRDPLDIDLQGRRLTVQATVHYWLQVGLGAGTYVKPLVSCGLGREGLRQARLGVEAEFALRPDWSLELKVRLQEPRGLNPCQVSALQYDLTPRVLAGMKDTLLRTARDIEAQVAASAMLREKAGALWRQLQEPLELSEGIWLLLNPERLRMGPWATRGRQLLLVPEVQAQPVVILGPRPDSFPRPLPPLEPSTSPLEPGFRVKLEGILPFEHASAQLRRQVVGRRIETPKGTVEIQDAAVRGEGARALLEITLTGGVKGKLTLAGRPVFHAATGTLRIADLDYTLECRNWITRFGAWILHSSLRKTLAEKADWILDQGFQDLRALVQAGLNRSLGPGLDLKGHLDALRLDPPTVEEDRFAVAAYLEGVATVEVRGL